MLNYMLIRGFILCLSTTSLLRKESAPASPSLSCSLIFRAVSFFSCLIPQATPRTYVYQISKITDLSACLNKDLIRDIPEHAALSYGNPRDHGRKSYFALETLCNTSVANHYRKLFPCSAVSKGCWLHTFVPYNVILSDQAEEVEIQNKVEIGNGLNKPLKRSVTSIYQHYCIEVFGLCKPVSQVKHINISVFDTQTPQDTTARMAVDFGELPNPTNSRIQRLNTT
jgi:hypothetical protein